MLLLLISFNFELEGAKPLVFKKLTCLHNFAKNMTVVALIVDLRTVVALIVDLRQWLRLSWTQLAYKLFLYLYRETHVMACVIVCLRDRVPNFECCSPRRRTS